MPDDDMPSTRPGSGADLSRRIERLEQNYGELATTVKSVEVTVGHIEELNRLRFASLEGAIAATGRDVAKVGTDLEGFMARIEGLVSGEIQTSQSRAGAELVADYQKWRTKVDERLAIIYTPEQRATIEARLDQHDRLEVQLRLLGRLAVLLVTSNVLAWGAAIYALTQP